MHIPDILYKIGYAICHQIPEKSFFVYGQPLPLCSRCTGIYLGIFLSFAFYFFAKILKNKKPSLPPPLAVNIASLIFALLMAINALTDSFGLGGNGNDFRLLTGIFFGFTLPLYLLTAFNYSKRFKSQNIHIITTKEYFTLIPIIISFSLIFLLKINYFLYISAYLSILGLLLFAFMLNITVIILIFDEIKKLNKFSYHYAAIFSLLMTIGEFIMFGFIRSKII